jgi:hypothetical protein
MSSFRVTAWLPMYLRWYWFAFGRRLGLDRLRRRVKPENENEDSG